MKKTVGKLIKFPDVELKVVINAIGYQADLYIANDLITSRCRDFGCTHTTTQQKDLMITLAEELLKTLDTWG